MTTIALYGLSLLLLSRFAAGDDPAEDAPAAAQPVPRIAVGAIRWDAWHGEASSVGEVVEGTLGPKRYHNRLPFFAKVISDDQVEIRGDTQEVMDREIAYAHEAGLVDFLTSPETLMAEAEATAKKFATGPTRAYGGIKETMLRARTQGLETQMEDEAQTLAAISYSDDSWEGLSAFLEKRAPNFRGR